MLGMLLKVNNNINAVHVALVDAKDVKGRFITCQDTSVFVKDIAKQLKSSFEKGFNVTDNVIFIIIFSLLVKM